MKQACMGDSNSYPQELWDSEAKTQKALQVLLHLQCRKLIDARIKLDTKAGALWQVQRSIRIT